jgi:DNA-binding HxlR family transcriptional regulator
MEDIESTLCPRVEAAFSLLSRKWAGLILFALSGGEKRFRELESAVAGISARLLSQRMRELEAGGLVHRRVIDSSPPGTVYKLSAAGEGLAPILGALADWAKSEVGGT